MPDTKVPQAFKAISIGTELAFSVLIGGLLGYLIGKIFGETWAAIGLSMGILLGFVVGIYNTIIKKILLSKSFGDFKSKLEVKKW